MDPNRRIGKGIGIPRGGTLRMGLGELWIVGLGTFFFLAVFLGLFYLRKVLRSRLFPGEGERESGEAMTELLLLQARLEEEAGLRTLSRDDDEDGP